MQIIKGKVIKGKGIGKTIGFPTLNIKIGKSSIGYGVYKVNAIINGKLFKGAGCYLEGGIIFEVHIFDFNKDIYGKEIEIIILKKIRDNKKFDKSDQLSNQIKRDILIIKKTKITVLTFGTFDIFHKGHEFYLNEAKKYGDKLITIIGRDTTVEKLKGFKPRQSESERLKNVKKSGIPDEAHLGNESDFLYCLKKFKASTICLGYDQKSHLHFNLEKYLKENKLDGVEVVVISSYKPGIYKSSKLISNF